MRPAVYIVTSNDEAARELRDALIAIGVRVLGVPWLAQTAELKREAARHAVTCIECADLVVALSPCELFEVGVAIGTDTDVLFVGTPTDACMFSHDRMHCTDARGQALVDEIVSRIGRAPSAAFTIALDRREGTMMPAGWSETDAPLERETAEGYRLMVQSVCTDVNEYSTEAEVSCNGKSHARVWIGDTSAAARAAAMWWCEGVAETANWHEEAP